MPFKIPFRAQKPPSVVEFKEVGIEIPKTTVQLKHVDESKQTNICIRIHNAWLTNGNKNKDGS